MLSLLILGGTYPNNELDVVLSACVGHVSSSAHGCVPKTGEEDCCHGPHPSDHCLPSPQTCVKHRVFTSMDFLRKELNVFSLLKKRFLFLTLC